MRKLGKTVDHSVLAVGFASQLIKNRLLFDTTGTNNKEEVEIQRFSI